MDCFEGNKRLCQTYKYHPKNRIQMSSKAPNDDQNWKVFALIDRKCLNT